MSTGSRSAGTRSCTSDVAAPARLEEPHILATPRIQLQRSSAVKSLKFTSFAQVQLQVRSSCSKTVNAPAFSVGHAVLGDRSAGVERQDTAASVLMHLRTCELELACLIGAAVRVSIVPLRRRHFVVITRPALGRRHAVGPAVLVCRSSAEARRVAAALHQYRGRGVLVALLVVPGPARRRLERLARIVSTRRRANSAEPAPWGPTHSAALAMAVARLR